MLCLKCKQTHMRRGSAEILLRVKENEGGERRVCKILWMLSSQLLTSQPKEGEGQRDVGANNN